MSLLIVKNITKKFTYPQNLTVLNNVSFTLDPEQSIAIMGASGVGKTTLLHILGTLENFDSGEFIYNDQHIQDLDLMEYRNQQIGFVFQSYQLFSDFTVLENLLMPAKIARKHSQDEVLKAETLLKDVSLYQRKDFPVRLLSGGEKQRVAIARAFMNDPQIILADEPTGNLDADTSKKIHQQLFFSIKKRKKALIVVTHDQELAKMCDQVYYLIEGILKTSP